MSGLRENVTKRSRTNSGETSEGIEKATEGCTHPLETAAFPGTRYKWGSYQCPAEGGISRDVEGRLVK